MRTISFFISVGFHILIFPWPGINKLFSGRESLVSDIPAGDRKIENLFFQCNDLCFDHAVFALSLALAKCLLSLFVIKYFFYILMIKCIIAALSSLPV
jgi:hypothetical protein